jgi:hypothetical protein
MLNTELNKYIITLNVVQIYSTKGFGNMFKLENVKSCSEKCT